MFSISKTDINLEFRFHFRPIKTFPPPSEAVISTDQVVVASSEPHDRDIPASFEGPVPALVKRRTAPKSGERSWSAAPLDVASGGARLRSEGGGENLTLEFGHLRSIMYVLHKSPADLFPANRITAKCSKCLQMISRGDGYRHNRVGEKKIYCADCHIKMGLPLRDVTSELAK